MKVGRQTQTDSVITILLTIKLYYLIVKSSHTLAYTIQSEGCVVMFILIMGKAIAYLKLYTQKLT